MKQKKLYRISKNKVIAGVATGLSVYFGIDVTLVRIVFVLASLFGGGGIIAYLIFWLLTPAETDVQQDESYSVLNDDQSNEPVKLFETKNGGILAGLILIAIGAYILLQKVFHWVNFQYFWPSLLILAGIVILVMAIGKFKKDE